MPTDEERRRVARKLREYASWDGEEDCFVDCADWGERVLNLLYRDGEDRTEGEYYARLADLIEPAQDHFRDAAKAVDRRALLALADEIEGHECVMRCCNDAFAGIMFVALNHEHIARRIREACGEVDG